MQQENAQSVRSLRRYQPDQVQRVVRQAIQEQRGERGGRETKQLICLQFQLGFDHFFWLCTGQNQQL